MADLTLDRHVLREVIKKEICRPPGAEKSQHGYGDCFQLSVRRSCLLIRLRHATWYCRSQARDSSGLGKRLRELATARPRFGYERLRILRTREAWRVRQNPVHRLYELEGLRVPARTRRRKRISLHRGPAPIATGGGQYWAMNFVHDQLSNGRKLRVLTVIDKWHRQCVARQADFALTGYSVVEAMNTIAQERELPYAIAVAHETELASKVRDEWRYLRGMKLDFIRPGKPTESGFIESFNWRLRDECLNVDEFATLDEVRAVLNACKTTR